MFPSDFEAKTSHLTLAEDGAYNRLLRICWMTPGCTIPADEAWIMRRVRAHTEDEKEAVRAVLSEFFTVEKGRYSNARLLKEWLAANEAHEKRKNAGSKGGKAKSLKTNKTGSSNAVAKPKQPEPEPEPYKREAKASAKETSPEDILAGVASRDTAANFVAYRREIKKPLTKRSAVAMANKIRGHADPDAVLNESIANGWQGVFPDKVKSTQSARQGRTDAGAFGSLREFN
jgi:uncharacterized protein YdaU (DUF1376 family)